MKPRRFHGANSVYRLGGGNEDNDLWVRIEPYEDTVLGRVNGVTSVWELTDDERQAVAHGANVELHVVGAGHPPVSMAVTNVELGKAPA